MRSALAYVPRRGPLGEAGALAASCYLGSFALVAFVFASPIVLAGAGAAIVLTGLAAGARRALGAAARWGLALGGLIVAVNAIVVNLGETILVRGYKLPVLGRLDITAEALAEGGVLALRVLVVLLAFAVFSACVDPDRVMRMLRPIARRSALTAALIARMVPLAAADHARLREAAALRGPAAAPVGRAALARRLVAGSLDRAVDVAATLELRGYARGAPRAVPTARRSRHDRALLLTGIAVATAAVVARLAGAGGFDAYPSTHMDLGAAELLLAVALPTVAVAPLARAGRAGGAPSAITEVSRA